MLRYPLIVLASWLAFALPAQYDHEAVFPELSGTALLEALQINYTPADVLSFADARDTLFSVVWGKNDSLSCAYTAYTRYMDPNEDPTQAVFNNGAANGINTEHSYPQSKGASNGNPRADMHHLFPTRVDVNGTRASFPFANIPDNETTHWFFDDSQMSNIPTQGIDNYSEFGNQSFEVRESFKGNIARAIFYFYTVYREQADNADSEFFPLQQETLCLWHQQDPVDQEEWENTYKIASYQDGKVNPFVLDCSLTSRLYCNVIDDACRAVGIDEPQEDKEFSIIPNPSFSYLNLKHNISSIKYVNILSSSGKTIQRKPYTGDRIDISQLAKGYYILSLETIEGIVVRKFLVR